MDRRKVHEMDTIRKSLMLRVSHRNGEAGLSHATRPDQGDKTCEVDCSCHALDIALSTNETDGRWQTGNCRLLLTLDVSGIQIFRVNLSDKLVSASCDGRDVGCMRRG